MVGPGGTLKLCDMRRIQKEIPGPNPLFLDLLVGILKDTECPSTQQAALTESPDTKVLSAGTIKLAFRTV